MFCFGFEQTHTQRQAHIHTDIQIDKQTDTQIDIQRQIDTRTQAGIPFHVKEEQSLFGHFVA
jgi:hypothetical protein